MTQSNVVPLRPKASLPKPLWPLFVLEDIKLCFQEAENKEASAVMEEAIRKLEDVLFPDAASNL